MVRSHAKSFSLSCVKKLDLSPDWSMWRDTYFLFKWCSFHILNVAEHEDYSLNYIHSCGGHLAPFRKFSNAVQY